MVLSNITISHNGNVPEYQHIAEEYNVKLNTECDSEIICHMVNVVGIENTISQLSNTGPIALLILQGNKITAFRKGQPLYVIERDGCFYFCSRKFLNARSLEEGQILIFGG
nr:MAG TPA: amidotransferase class II [Caudoviricetes sp.]